ncbi:MAG: hypothetical protein ACTSU2_14780 [Promethearchaeota archaeon]
MSATNIIARILISAAYFILFYMGSMLWYNWLLNYKNQKTKNKNKNKNNNNNKIDHSNKAPDNEAPWQNPLKLRSPQKWALIAALIGILPNLDIIVIYIIAGIRNPLCKNCYIAVHENVFTHNAILFSVVLLFMILIGFGKWKWQTPVQMVLGALLAHWILDYLLYGMPIFFTYYLWPYEMEEYGFQLLSRLNLLFSGLNINIVFMPELVVLIVAVSLLFIYFYFGQAIRIKSRKQ